MAKVEKPKTLDSVMEELNKQYGAGSVIYGDNVEKVKDVISTGSLGLDYALGIGGLPMGGKIVEIFGWESSGKSTLTQTIIGNAQKKFKESPKTQHLKCLLIDGENSLDSEYATKLGVDLKELILIQLDQHGGEGAYNKMTELVKTGEIGLVVVDSYNSLQPKTILESDIGESALGKHARMQGQVVMKANELATEYNTLFIFIGQLREKIGVMYGSPETTQGGNALRFYSHIRLAIRKSLNRDGSKEVVSNRTTVKVEKNKLAPPFNKAEFDILYGEGIDKIAEAIEFGAEIGVLERSGAWYSFNGEKLGNGVVNVREVLESKPELLNEIRSKINERILQE